MERCIYKFSSPPPTEPPSQDPKMTHRVTQLALILSLCLLSLSLPSEFSSILSETEELGGSEDERSAVAELFRRWALKHGKAYEQAEERERRFENFRMNVRYVTERKARRGDGSHVVGLNKFADLSNEEFREGYLLKKKKIWRRDGEWGKRKMVGCEAPEAMDWRKRGAVTGVKDQGACGTCAV